MVRLISGGFIWENYYPRVTIPLLMDQVGQVRERTDIVALINSFVPLKKMGHNFKANCPFHNEKTPSFVVSPERQMWHCFGCGKGGDCFSFLMEYERIEFPEALRILADKAGIQLEQKGFDTAVSSKKEIIYKLNTLAAEFYHYLLTKHPVGEKALAYVLDRKIKPQTIDTYMIGFAPSNGNALVQYLIKKKQYKPEDILEAGLATKRTGGIVDFFFGRLMFPLYDHRGNVIGFSGRILVDNDKTSKYINTRETVVYHKGSVFFGLNSSKEAIKKENKAIIMEGEFDVIAAFQEGVTNTVAIKGTALTEDQVSLLSRFTTNVALCLDSDNAGQEAMRRSLPILEKKGITTTIIQLAGGKDPDEMIKTDPVSFKKAVKHDRPVYDVLIATALQTYNPASVDGKKRIGETVLPLLASISNEIVKDHYLRLLATSLHASPEVLLKEMDRLLKKEIIKEPMLLPQDKRSREEALEEYVIALIIQDPQPQKLIEVYQQFVAEYDWLTPAYKKILDHLAKFSSVKKEFDSKVFLAGLPQELLPAFDRCFLLPLPVFQNDEALQEELQKITQDLFALGLKRQIKAITDRIKTLESTDDEHDAELIALQNQLTPLLLKLSNRIQK